jgi:hypothetical protein
MSQSELDNCVSSYNDVKEKIYFLRKNAIIQNINGLRGYSDKTEYAYKVLLDNKILDTKTLEVELNKLLRKSYLDLYSYYLGFSHHQKEMRKILDLTDKNAYKKLKDDALSKYLDKIALEAKFEASS